MTEKILILSGSPRKGGNSDYICNQFLKGATESGHDVEKIFVSEKKSAIVVPVTLVKILTSA